MVDLWCDLWNDCRRKSVIVHEGFVVRAENDGGETRLPAVGAASVGLVLGSDQREEGLRIICVQGRAGTWGATSKALAVKEQSGTG
jgi:hypothetical protein